MEVYEGRYKYEVGVELSIISPESIVRTHGKTFVKTEDLAYLSRIKKHGKV